MKQLIAIFIVLICNGFLRAQTTDFTEDEKEIYYLLIGQFQTHLDTNFRSDKVNGYEIKLRKETTNQYNLIDANNKLNELAKDLSVFRDIKDKNKIVYPTKGFDIKKATNQTLKKRINFVDVVFSRCGFAGNQALVYFGVQYDKMSGYGDLILLEKDKDGKWKVLKRLTKWAS